MALRVTMIIFLGRKRVLEPVPITDKGGIVREARDGGYIACHRIAAANRVRRFIWACAAVRAGSFAGCSGKPISRSLYGQRQPSGASNCTAGIYGESGRARI